MTQSEFDPPEPLELAPGPPFPPLPLPARVLPYSGPHVGSAYDGGTFIPPGTLDGHGNIARDVSCRKCAYNLRGMPLAGRCPECGRAVGLSVMGDLLRFSDPVWLGTLRRGVNLILLGVIVVVANFALVFFLRLSPIRVGSMPLTAVLPVASHALTFIGAWFLTTADPSGIGEDLYGTSRRVIRVTLLLGLFPVFSTAMISVAPLPLDFIRLLQLIGIIFQIAGLVGQYAKLQYLQKLALRIPDRALSDRANFLKVALTVSYGIVVLFGSLMWVMIRMVGTGGMMFVGCFTGIAGIALIVFSIMYLVMLQRFRNAIAEQEEFARASWSAEPVG